MMITFHSTFLRPDTLQADDMVAALGVLAQGETNAALIESMDPWMPTDLNEKTALSAFFGVIDLIGHSFSGLIFCFCETTISV